ncbi:hypothetical protein OESDEN_01058 [Oesophagostomum dentatum]|uniref:Uncharacterized protein n=1 Tax=Oesophagostomum dentatum TaxID=61180 RepID=A0A0B1TSY7_OESDE|nr:hypothetical protein OESDEN_01058 [Oesophagostomum dentatum]
MCTRTTRRTITPLRYGILASRKENVASNKKRGTRSLAVTLGTTHTDVETGLKSRGLVKKLASHCLRQLDCDRCIDACTTLLTLHKNTNWLNHLITGEES